MRVIIAIGLVAIALASVLALRYHPQTMSGKFIDDTWPKGRIDTWVFTNDGKWSETTTRGAKILSQVTGIYLLHGKILDLTWQHLYGFRKGSIRVEWGIPNRDAPEEFHIVSTKGAIIMISRVRGPVTLKHVS